MPTKIHDLKPAPGSKPKKQRVARGVGGRRGKTAGTGTKGQGTRDTIKPGFEGGQTPLTRRTPKLKGFKKQFRIEYTVMNLDHLDGFPPAPIRPRRSHPMLSRLRNLFRVADLRNKIPFTLVIIAIYRLGSHLPLPYVDFSAIQALKDRAAQGGALEFLDLFSGGALTNVAVFALGIMPYITSSIIMQLLAVVIPKLEEWQQQGQVGQKKITQWTRYLTVALALMQSTGIVFALHQGGGSFLGSSNALNGIDLIPHFGAARVLLIVTTLTAGTAMIMWLGELITQRGIGNGMSILIFSSVVSRLPAQGSAIWATGNYFQFSTVIAMGIGMIVGIIFVEQGQRRIPVQFAKRVAGRRMYGGQSTYIPMKVNQSGVIPIIFASSLLYFPVLLSSALPEGMKGFINRV